MYNRQVIFVLSQLPRRQIFLLICLISSALAFVRPATVALHNQSPHLQGRDGIHDATAATSTPPRKGAPRMSAYSEPVPQATDPPFRIGHGFDIHRLEAGLPLVIGGVKIEFEKGSAAHSDGDALYHSVTDAILGAIGLPDIGQLFPDTDPKWKGADSAQFMREARRLMTLRGYRIGNVDVTLILQKPKVKDIKPQMKANLVELLGTEESRVNIKARTHEHVDSVGESRSWVVHVVILLEKV
ncbi:2-C-methyl-D-erythritol 2,4-cyclodiphosphate synthase [Nannochloropsis gaditana CCMP526]|uniref:2-C-methyl-D-erythritol 2,4-cyclodiphosphate synthase n=1 Tax=Nannochloropsis gaditana (strain CCMP526) TaxID=1093141 RepID=UPI00029F51C1|nr:2-C-methyl-D-erythritol 2,4-cyclodiphosphate synthase [Nannochloropsis gaditana CCMP526]EKU22275.1 2-C-methyl-D-erythritol 2,4-cyclodiphosphate synthase [Nannochloropsis gaditana CCMP526]|eukprot:XP_005854081.1 2-C-methyl-D-erythritol 2,4-cyclodiphosphate synthase [Nannochloropsis gaditana CCMP526]